MPLFFFVIGFLLIDAGVRGNAKDVASQLATDVQGFLAFGAAIIILGVLGMSQTARPIAKSFLVLVFVVFLLKNGNAVVNGLTSAASAPSDSSSSTMSSILPATNSASGAPTGQGAGSTDYSGDINTATSLLSLYSEFA